MTNASEMQQDKLFLCMHLGKQGKFWLRGPKDCTGLNVSLPLPTGWASGLYINELSSFVFTLRPRGVTVLQL